MEAAAPIATLSKRVLGLDWSTVLPWRFEEITVEPGEFERDALPFISAHYAAIFGTSGDEAPRFFVEPMTDAKRRFSAEMDVFLFRADGRTVGIHLSHPSDWSTYYMRTTALLPEYRGRRLVRRMLERMEAPLRSHGVARIEGDVTPTNAAMVRVNLEQGYVVTSTSTSDRWGMLLRFTKFLRRDVEDVFVRQFCAMAVTAPKTEPHTEARSSS